jgi:hypothetical protein
MSSLMNKYILTLVVLASFTELHGQDSTKTDDCRTKTIKHTFTVKPYHKYKSTYEMDGQLLTMPQLTERLNIFPESASEFNRYKKSTKAAKLTFAIGVPLIIAGAVIYGQQKDASTGLLIGGAIVMVSIIQIPGFQAIKHRKKSIEIYNSKICRR